MHGTCAHTHPHTHHKGENFQICFNSNSLFKLGACNPPRYHRKNDVIGGEYFCCRCSESQDYLEPRDSSFEVVGSENCPQQYLLDLFDDTTISNLLQHFPSEDQHESRERAWPWSFRCGHPILISPCWHLHAKCCYVEHSEVRKSQMTIYNCFLDTRVFKAEMKNHI